MDWPDDAHGDVMRRLREHGFNFEEVATIDFNVDFEDWPPSREALDAISGAFPDATASVEDGYVLMQCRAKLTYTLVMDVQAQLSQATEPFGGKCDSWGVLHPPSAKQ